LTTGAGEVYTTPAPDIGGIVPIDPRLMEILICPACRGEVRLLDTGEGIECRDCRRVYPVRDGIPIMLEEEAETPGGKDGPA
jgi:uncharacterized protein YbaR (Trm112 family)